VDKQTVHRGYLIKACSNDLRDGYWVHKDDCTICWAKTTEEAKAKVDDLLKVWTCGACGGQTGPDFGRHEPTCPLQNHNPKPDSPKVPRPGHPK